MIISVDLATKAGISWYTKGYTIYTKSFKGTPLEQLNEVLKISKSNKDTILFEEFVYFAKSMKTVASLLKRLGFVEYSLRNKGYEDVHLLNPNSVRAKYFTGKSKKQKCLEYFKDKYDFVDDNMTDSLLQIVYYKDIPIEKVKLKHADQMDSKR